MTAEITDRQIAEALGFKAHLISEDTTFKDIISVLDVKNGWYVFQQEHHPDHPCVWEPADTEDGAWENAFEPNVCDEYEGSGLYKWSIRIGDAFGLLWGLDWEMEKHLQEVLVYTVIADDMHIGRADTLPQAICGAWLSWHKAQQLNLSKENKND